MLLSFALRGLDLRVEFLEALADLPATSSGSRSPEMLTIAAARFRRDEPHSSGEGPEQENAEEVAELAAAMPSAALRLLNRKISAAQTKVVEFGPIAVKKWSALPKA
jgi:hypothetical protein